MHYIICCMHLPSPSTNGRKKYSWIESIVFILLYWLLKKTKGPSLFYNLHIDGKRTNGSLQYNVVFVKTILNRH